MLATNGASHKILSLGDIEPSFAASLDAIIVLGGGAPNGISSPPIWTATRCDYAAKVFDLAQSFMPKTNLPAILTLSAGTAHVPQFLSRDGLPVWESTSSAAYIMDHYKSIPPSNIYVETSSYDTISNAFFTRTSHTDIAEWKNILAITNVFHMSRSKVIFDWIFSMDIDKENAYTLNYLACPDTGLTPGILEARNNHELRQRTNIEKNLIPRMKNLREVWHFLTHEHDFYSASGLVKRGKGDGIKSSVSLKGSYGAEGWANSPSLAQYGKQTYIFHTISLLYIALTTLILGNLLCRKKIKKSDIIQFWKNESNKDGHLM